MELKDFKLGKRVCKIPQNNEFFIVKELDESGYVSLFDVQNNQKLKIKSGYRFCKLDSLAHDEILFQEILSKI